MNKSIFSNLPNNLIINIIKLAEDKRKEEERKEYEEYLLENDPEYRFEMMCERDYNNPPEWAYDWGNEPSWA
tara:strand:+ start:122 stop:337 length:216 start_codon:yes stop_codon:yes gene_type:complete